MPPRLPAACNAQLANVFESSPLVIQSTVTAAGRPLWPSPSQRQTTPRQQSSCFSTTTRRELTKPQRKFHKWLRTVGKGLRDPSADGTPRYVQTNTTAMRLGIPETKHPFPSNPEFESQPVLSEEARELVWGSVMTQGMPLKAVAARHGIDMRRVAAVVRMKEIEKVWEATGKQLAKPYSKAVMGMLPKANLSSEEPFEPINDIHVSPHTQQQLFVPVPESRQFTRTDAAKAFGDHILPPEEKMRIPELLSFEKDIANGVDRKEAREKFLLETARNEQVWAYKQRHLASEAERKKTRVKSGRFEFRFENISVDSAGKHGRDRGAVGWRYGVPFNDRRRGVVKIPTKVE